MNNIFKQLGGLATNSKADSYTKAVIRLTVYYTVGVLFILLTFTVLVYSLFSLNIEDVRTEDEHEELVIAELGEEQLSHELTENLRQILILSDVVLLLVTVLVSYLLARKTLAPLAQAHEIQKRFIADAAHELRTPLAVLKAGSELLLQNERSIGDYKRFTREAQEEIDRLIVLANDLLFLAQNKEVRKSYNRPFSLSEVAQAQCERIIPYALSKGITIHTEIDPDVVIEGNRDDISRLILNLLKNAVDYNKEKGLVTTVLRRVNSEAVLSVRDTGLGISSKDIPYIFDRFYKVDTSRSGQSATGSGLGLSIVKEILTTHGGTVHVESTPHEGTRFELHFPRV